MKFSLVALEPTSCYGKTFEHFAKSVRLLQSAKIFEKTTITSLYHPSLSLLPLHIYSKEKHRLMQESKAAIKGAAQNFFQFESVEVIHSGSSMNQSLALKLNEHAKSNNHELVIIGSSNRSGIPYWLLGSFAETFALLSHVSTLIIKPIFLNLPRSKKPTFILSIDILLPPTSFEIKKISQFSKSSNAKIHLLYVTPKRKKLLGHLQKIKSNKEAQTILKGVASAFNSYDIKPSIHIVEEKISIGHTVSDYAEKAKAWMIITLHTQQKRSMLYRVFLGSKAHQILKLSKRPCLSLK